MPWPGSSAGAEPLAMSWLPSLFNALLGAGVVFALIPVILHYSPRANLNRRAPEVHHTHKGSVPRLGGLALAAAFLVGTAVMGYRPPILDELRMASDGGKLMYFAIGTVVATLVLWVAGYFVANAARK